MHSFLSNLHRSLANPQLYNIMSLCAVACLKLKHATIQTCYPVCYLKNLYLVTTDSYCLQSCQYTLLYSIFITDTSWVLLCTVLFLTYLYLSSNEVSKLEYSILDAV